MQNKRHTLVVNKTFQYQHALLSAFISVLLINASLISALLFPETVGIHLELTFFQATMIGAAEFAVILVVWYASIKASLHIAGPVYVLQRDLNRVGNGELNFRLKLRSHDSFHELEDAFNKNIGTLKNKIVHLKAISEKLSHSPQDESLIKELKTELEFFKTTEETGTDERR